MMLQDLLTRADLRESLASALDGCENDFVGDNHCLAIKTAGANIGEFNVIGRENLSNGWTNCMDSLADLLRGAKTVDECVDRVIGFFSHQAKNH